MNIRSELWNSILRKCSLENISPRMFPEKFANYDFEKKNDQTKVKLEFQLKSFCNTIKKSRHEYVIIRIYIQRCSHTKILNIQFTIPVPIDILWVLNFSTLAYDAVSLLSAFQAYQWYL